MYEIPINAAGRLTADPQRTVRRDGVVVAKLDVEVSQRRQTPEGWRVCGMVRLECRAWGALAEHALESLGCGDRVVVIGRLRQRPVSPGAWTYDVVVEDLGVSLRFANVWPMPSEPVEPGEPVGVIVNGQPRPSARAGVAVREA